LNELAGNHSCNIHPAAKVCKPVFQGKGAKIAAARLPPVISFCGEYSTLQTGFLQTVAVQADF
jgi:hypothetical protein